MALFKMQIGSTPITPPTGWVYLYPKSDGKLYSKDDTGTETELTAPGNHLLLSGPGAPAPTTGKDDDFYLDTVTYDLYGPKVSGAWGTPTSLIGPTGSTGPVGPTGPTGAAATVAAGSTTTGAPGSSASVVNSGTSSAAVFDFTIPRGDVGAQGPQGSPGPQGNAATIAVGTTTTLPAGSSASVNNSGTSSAAIFNFSIPKGDTTWVGNIDGGRANSVYGGTFVIDGGNSTSF